MKLRIRETTKIDTELHTLLTTPFPGIKANFNLVDPTSDKTVDSDYMESDNENALNLIDF